MIDVLPSLTHTLVSTIGKRKAIDEINESVLVPLHIATA